MSKAWWLLASTILALDAFGAVCGDLADPDRRLACYERGAACAGIDEPAARLTCYDEAYGAQPSLPSPAAPSPGAAAGTGGGEPFPVQGKIRREAAAARLVAEVVDVTRDRRGRRVLTLDNGQVWRELSEGRLPLEAGTEVELEPGVLGSVNLRAAGRDGFIKVRRMQ